ncbi:hypothetical protein Scep_013497 [Stephania cephalantha]|uniref:Uncharacterized protein n=1 Tax=Stephania cephalantha TaxID=152367 RepID=A0AAP0JHK7_9MAGN
MVGFDEHFQQQLFPIPPSDPVVTELNRLQNQLKEKERELGAAHSEIKALRVSEVLKEKAVEELSFELEKLDEKLRVNESLLEHKNLEIKKLANEKKEAFAAQFAAEATLRRVHANQKDEDFVPVEAVIAPLEADIRMYKNEIGALQEDKKALERLTKSKESALLEAERILKSALERALIVEEVQNQNMELKRQIEICQEENRVLDKTNRQKVSEVEKLGQTIRELEESILAGGAAANAVRDYQRQISELNDEKRILERELARAKVSANRVAAVVANEWKDDNDKVMPVKQWLEERRFMQAEIQRLKDKLAISERAAKAEAQIKDKLRLRLKTLEEGLKHVSSFSSTPNVSCGSQKTGKSNPILGFLDNAGLRKRSSSQPRGSVCANKSSPLNQPNLGTETPNVPGQLKRVNSLKSKYGSGENLVRKKLWASSRSKVVDSTGKENSEMEANSNLNLNRYAGDEVDTGGETKSKDELNAQNNRSIYADGEDLISGFLYDRLQREVISLRKSCEDKEGTLNAKDDEIKILMRKVDALTKAMEVESKKLKREAAAREKEVMSAKPEESKSKIKIMASFSKRTAKAS